jgi:hypothetical protein
MKKLIFPLVFVVFAAGACWSFGGEDELGNMEIRAQGGKVTIERAGKTIPVREDSVPLEPKDVVNTGTNGLASLKLEGERSVKMQPKAQIVIDSTRSIVSERGSVLVSAPVSTTVELDGAQASATKGIFRIDQGFGTARAASYTANLRLVSPGQSRLTVTPLYEATIAAGEVPGVRKPYRLDANDPWDQDQLQEVIKLENELDLLSRGFSRQLGNDRPDIAYFNALSDGSNVSFMRPYLKRRPVDLLIGFTVADNDRKRSLKESFRQAFRLFDQGATWGVTATILDVSARPVVAELENVIIGTGVVADGGAGDEPEFTVAAGEEGSSDQPPGQSDTFDSVGGGEDDVGGSEAGNEEEPGDGEGGGEEGGGEEEENCEPTDVECQARRVFSPSPSPSDDDPLDDVVGGGDRGKNNMNAW